jgi:hypothetical protein
MDINILFFLLLFIYNMKQAASMASSCYLVCTGFLLGLPFNPKDGGNMFLQKIS